jgi:DNA-binding transcriptional LysR family regulator
MDIDLAQTFLTVVSAGSFARAAQRLHVTQAAVSARVQALESELGRSLFVRSKAGTRMTAAGQEFLPYATRLVQVWERARQRVALRPGREAVLSLGGEVSLWSALVLNWLIALRRERPGVALRASVDAADRLLSRVQNGSLDIAVLYTPHHRPGLDVVPLIEEELVAVSTVPDQTTISGDDYVFVDWGPDFTAQHDAAFPGMKDAGLCVGLGPLALRYLLLVGGTGYFRKRAAQRYIDSGQLHLVKGTPTFSYSAYAAYSTQADAALLAWARDALVKATHALPEQWA